MRLERTAGTTSQLDRFQALARRLSSVGEQVNVKVNGNVVYGGGFRIDNAKSTPLYDGAEPRTQLLFVPRNEVAGLTTHVLELTRTRYTSLNDQRSNRNTRELSLRYTEMGRLLPWGRRVNEEIPAQKPFAPVDEKR